MVDQISKGEIAKAFKWIEKYGFKVRNMGDNHRGRKSRKDLPDCFIVGHGCFHAIEIKVGADKLSKGQKEYADELKKVEKKNKTVFYWLCTEKNYKQIIDKILLMM